MSFLLNLDALPFCTAFSSQCFCMTILMMWNDTGYVSILRQIEIEQLTCNCYHGTVTSCFTVYWEVDKIATGSGVKNIHTFGKEKGTTHLKISKMFNSTQTQSFKYSRWGGGGGCHWIQFIFQLSFTDCHNKMKEQPVSQSNLNTIYNERYKWRKCRHCPPKKWRPKDLFSLS